MNQKTILALVAIIATVGILIAASSIATPSALALKLVREKDTKTIQIVQREQVVKRVIRSWSPYRLVKGWSLS